MREASSVAGTRPPAPGDWLTGGGEMGELIRSADWSCTPLGPRERWPAGMRAMVNMVVSNRLPMALLWGRDLLFIYNDAYRLIAADRHPGALGRSTREVWPEVWHINRPIFAAVMDRGETVYLEDNLFPIDRNGLREDAYFTLCYSPVRVDDGLVEGTLVTLVETTGKLRREQMLEMRRQRAELEAERERVQRAEEQLRLLREVDDQRRRLQAVLDSVPIPVFITDDPAAQEMWGNRPCYELLRLPVGVNVSKSAPADRRPSNFRAMRDGKEVPPEELPAQVAASHGVEVRGFGFDLVFDDGEVRNVVCNATPLRNEHGEVRGSVTAMVDVTELQKAHAEAEEGRRTLQALMDNVPEGITIADADGVIRMVSRFGQDLLGGPHNEAIQDVARRWKVYRPHDGTEMPLDELPLNRALRGETVRDAEIIEAGRFGTRLNLLCNAAPICDAQGHIWGGVVTWQDITERKRAEHVLREKEEFSRKLIESSRDCIKTLDLAGNLLSMSEGGQKLLEIADLQPLLNRSWIDLWRPDDRPRVRQAVELATRGGTGRFHAYCLSSSGRPRWWDVIITPIRGPQQEVERLLAISREVTEQVIAEQALRESEARFRDLADNIAQLAWMADETGKIFWYNRRWYEFTGTTLEEMKSGGGQKVLHPDHVQRVGDRIRHCFDTGEPWEDTFPLRGKDGAYRWFLSRALPIREDGGKVVRWFGTNTDVTEQRAAQERTRVLAELSAALAGTPSEEEVLRRSAATATAGYAELCLVDLTEGGRFQRTVASSPAGKAALADALVSYSPQRPRLEAIPEIRRVLHERQPLLITVTDPLLRALAQDERHLQILRALECESAIIAPMVARDRLLGVVTLARGKDQSRFVEGDLEVVASFAWRLGLAVDNARLLAAEHRARQEAEEANRVKDQFVALVSHELRNPLSAIASGIHLLRATCPADHRAGRALEIVERNTRLQTRLVNDLLDLSRLQRGKLHLQRAPVELTSTIKAACHSYDAEAREAGLSLTCALEPDLWVYGDADRLQQAVTNLLSNAVKFTPRGGSVQVATERREGQVRVAVTDTGIGLERAALDTLFEIFQQGELAGQHKPGLGIGLALVKGIAERHGGTVWAESEGAGRGARFVVALPLVAPPNRRVTTRAARRPAAGPISVLLVEDNPDTRGLIADALTLAGYEVHSAPSGEDALELLAGVRPDVMLVDIGLPGMDGFEFLRSARQLPGIGEVPAFAVTGYGAEEDVREGREAGFTGHFVKPVDVTALTRHIPEWLGAA